MPHVHFALFMLCSLREHTAPPELDLAVLTAGTAPACLEPCFHPQSRRTGACKQVYESTVLGQPVPWLGAGNAGLPAAAESRTQTVRPTGRTMAAG